MELDLIFRMVCQWFLALMMARAYFACVEVSINGRPAKEPTGFNGFVQATVGIVLFIALVWGTGAFDVLFGG